MSVFYVALGYMVVAAAVFTSLAHRSTDNLSQSWRVAMPMTYRGTQGTFVLANGTMTPYALWGPLAEGMLEIAYTSFAAGSIDTSLFTLPMECEQAAPCTDSARIRKRAIATHFA